MATQSAKKKSRGSRKGETRAKISRLLAGFWPSEVRAIHACRTFLRRENDCESSIKETLDPRSFALGTFAICGFANFASIAIQIGGIGTLAPDRRRDLASLGLRAMAGGILVSYINALDDLSEDIVFAIPFLLALQDYEELAAGRIRLVILSHHAHRSPVHLVTLGKLRGDPLPCIAFTVVVGIVVLRGRVASLNNASTDIVKRGSSVEAKVSHLLETLHRFSMLGSVMSMSCP